MKKDNLKSVGQDIIKNKPSETNTSQLQTRAKSERSFLVTPIKPGVILKDASNPSPGFGLWCTNINKNKEQPNATKEIKELYDKYGIENPENVEEQTHKSIITQLKYQCQDLNTKLMNSLSGYYEKENKSINAEKMQKEYQEIIDRAEEEKYQLEIHNHQLEETISNLTNALSNTQKEIRRLLDVIESNKAYVTELNNQFELKQLNEQKKQQKLKDKIIDLKKEIEGLSTVEQESTLKKMQSVMPVVCKQKVQIENNSDQTKPNPHKEEFQVKIFTDLILKLQIEIAKLKKTLRSSEEDKKNLNDIIKFKEQKNNFQRHSIDNLCSLMEEKGRESYWNNIVLKKKSGLLNNNKMKNIDIANKDLKIKSSMVQQVKSM